ncbi:hypothetical protein GCM10011386_11440 [Parapedobacter defluvii]|uniref:Methylamine utilisation protein MauE domain-containing protein n=1 Tax=Parapedobacter defluvii TaxID=2045106 RepID=A0ABQ1L9M6_9SPHI|nr:DoxX family protein [Parapedobacter defluvii]GGC21216.1 hypothetical protein GCM10011386_11440 [Parapedobacter defluvii]
MKTKALPIVRIGIALVFLTSGFAKVLDTQAFVALVHRYVPGNLAVMAVVIPPVEAMLGLCLLLGYQPREIAGTLAWLTLAFTLVYSYGLVTKGITDCACFGSVKNLQLPPWGVYIRNTLLLMGGFWMASAYPAHREAAPVNRIRGAIVLLFGAAAFLLAGMSFDGPLRRNRVDNPHWLGLPRSRTPFAALPLSADSTYALYLYRPDCPLCKDMAANAASWREAGLVDAVVALTARSQAAVSDSLFRPGYGRYFDTLGLLTDQQMVTAVSHVPTLVVIEGDTVKYIHTGHLANGFRIRPVQPNNEEP